MKLLPQASFRYVEIHHEEELLFIFFGPVSKPAFVQKHYVFCDSGKKNPDVIFTRTVEEGDELVKVQQESPILIYKEDCRRIYLYKDVFVECTKDIETIDAVRGIVLEKYEREAKRLERLQKKGGA